MRRSLALLLVTLAFPALLAAPPPRWERPVTPGGTGPNRLDLDVPILSGASPLRAGTNEGLGDLRLFAADGTEVPYLLVGPSRTEPRFSASRVLPVQATKTASGFEADLGRPLLVDRLEVQVLPAPYLKRARLEGSGDRARWTLLVAEGTLFDLPEEGLTRRWLGFPASELQYLRLTWDDTRSGRLPMPGSVRARLVGESAPPSPLRVAVPFEKRASEPRTSRYRLKLPGPDLPLASVEVVTGAGNVLRPATVTEARLVGSAVSPVPLGTATLRRAVRDDLAADEMTVPVVPPSETEIELVVEDGDNPPLPIREVSVLFAPLPWIYFESPDGAPLVARFGAPRGNVPRPPRYDLEATRSSVERGAVRVASARWGDRRESAPSAAPVTTTGPAVPPGAALAVDGFRFERAVPGGPAGLTALLLDAHVLANAPALASVRIVSQDGRQVPYLLESLGEPLEVPLPSPAPAQAPEGPSPIVPRSSVYRLTFPFAGLPDARLTVGTSARVFERNVTLLVEAEGRDRREGLRAVAGATWRHADPETPAPLLSIPLPPLPGTEALLAVDDGDNSPLPLEAPRLQLPARRLRFFREGTGKLSLLYGRDGLEAPRYDLALLAPRLLGAPAHELALAAGAAPVPRASGPDVPRLAFWGVLVAAVVLLLGLVVRLVRREEGAPGGPPEGP